MTYEYSYEYMAGSCKEFFMRRSSRGNPYHDARGRFCSGPKGIYTNENNDGTVYAFARGMDWKSRWLGVSKKNPSPNGEFVETLEKYDRLQDAEHSKYYLELRVAEQLLGATFFGTVNPEDVSLDDLSLACFIRNGL